MTLDVLIRHRPSMKYVSAGGSFYTRDISQILFGCAEVWQGYYQSVGPTRGKSSMFKYFISTIILT